MKYYAIRNTNNDGVYTSWDEVKTLVHGVSGAEYKSFKAREDAVSFLNNKKYYYAVKEGPFKGVFDEYSSIKDLGLIKFARFEKEIDAYRFIGGESLENYLSSLKTIDKMKFLDMYLDFEYDKDLINPNTMAYVYLDELKEQYKENPLPKGKAIAFVDGSFDKISKIYGYGIVFIVGSVVSIFHYTGDDPNWSKVNQIAGEVKASLTASKFAYALGVKDLEIYYDYTGLEKWITRDFKAKNEVSDYYVEAMNRILTEVNVSFNKIKSHTGDLGNELADLLAGLHTK